MGNRKLYSPDWRHERGIALITVLLFMMIMTIIGTAAMQSSTLQQWMSGNMRDQDMAFQAAENAARDGEAWLAAQPTFPPEQVGNCAPPCNVVWPLGMAAGVVDSYAQYLNATFWENPDHTPAANIWVGNPVQGSKTPPRLVIEHVGFIRESMGSRKWSSDPVGGELYRVTTRGTGQTDNSRAVIQTTYALGN